MAYAPDELHGVCGMSPAFSTPDAISLTATDTLDADNLRAGLDRVIRDGVQMIATTGTFGQVWNLLWDEWQTAVVASIEAVNKRVPLMLGVTSANPRETVQRMKFVQEQGGEGVLLGVPYYYKLPIPDVVSFYRNLAELFPKLSIMIYHNPTNHRVHIPVAAFEELVKNKNIVAMKDSHRTTQEFLRLHEIIHGKIAHFVYQGQMYPYFDMGASGCWSHAIWSGPWPILRLYQAAVDGDVATVKQIMDEITPRRSGEGGDGDAGRAGHSHHEFAGYVNFGPPRPPHSLILQDPAVEAKNIEERKAEAAQWQALCDKYRPQVEARRGVLAGVA